MANTKPFVAAALICEKLLEEVTAIPGGGNVVSAIRIVDVYVVPELKLPEGVSIGPDVIPAIEINGLIMLKSGDLTGNYTVGLNLRTPLGETKSLAPEGGWPVVLQGDEH